MISALIEIGKAVRDMYPLPLVELPYSGKRDKKAPKVLVVELNTLKDVLNLTRVKLFGYLPEDNIKKYYFRSPHASKGPASSLSFKLSEKLSALKERLGILSILNYKADTSEIARAIEKEVNRLNQEGLLEKNAQVLIVLKIDGKWPAENERLRENFVKNFLKSLASYEKNPIWKTYGLCHECGKETIIYGGVGNLLKFYTVDKHGYAPELIPELHGNNMPFAKSAFLTLKEVKGQWRIF